MTAAKLTAADIRDALARHFPPTEYLLVFEAPDRIVRNLAKQLDSIAGDLAKLGDPALVESV